MYGSKPDLLLGRTLQKLVSLASLFLGAIKPFNANALKRPKEAGCFDGHMGRWNFFALFHFDNQEL